MRIRVATRAVSHRTLAVVTVDHAIDREDDIKQMVTTAEVDPKSALGGLGSILVPPNASVRLTASFFVGTDALANPNDNREISINGIVVPELNEVLFVITSRQARVVRSREFANSRARWRLRATHGTRRTPRTRAPQRPRVAKHCNIRYMHRR